MGTGGHSRIGGLVLGSVTQRLLHVASCPVLAVPPVGTTPADSTEQPAAPSKEPAVTTTTCVDGSPHPTREPPAAPGDTSSRRRGFAPPPLQAAPAVTLSRAECHELLAATHVGPTHVGPTHVGRVVVTVGPDHRPLIPSVNYLFDQTAQAVTFRCRGHQVAMGDHGPATEATGASVQ